MHAWQATDAGKRGDAVTKKKYDQISVALTVAGIIFQVIGFLCIIGGSVGYYYLAVDCVSRKYEYSGSSSYSQFITVCS